MNKTARSVRGCARVVFLLLLVMSSACRDRGADDQPAGGADGPYSADLREAKRKASSTLERQILQDLTIERFEYEEAVDAYITCMNDRGVPTGKVEQSGYFVYRSQMVNDSVSAECRKGTIDLIESLYINQLTNPDRLDYYVLTRNCLVRHGVVDEAYTAKDYEKDELDNYASAPYDSDDERVRGCFANPSS